ncbi:uncharacterized protein [Misgurnus anguillicaudatus]|uniref:uncharacterized protein isoform X1 n=1 Tax=Misgurnus anguillicaudatus TaxID=75329 RepID=UPI003CCF10CE
MCATVGGSHGWLPHTRGYAPAVTQISFAHHRDVYLQTSPVAASFFIRWNYWASLQCSLLQRREASIAPQKTSTFRGIIQYQSCRDFMRLLLAYPLYVIDALLQRCEEKNIHLRVVCYIACVIASHLQKSGEGISHNIALAVPAFHVYGHKLPCKIKYSTRWLDGFGLTDGEGMERLWSFLQRFARVTKEMTPSHRLDLLTDALLHYGRRKSTDLEVQLLQRVDKAEKILILAQKDISCHQRGISVDF